MNKFNRPTMLMILDGYGINKKSEGNAIYAANKPHIDDIFKKYPNTTLKACGLDVGLPVGQMGNSEVGHLNIGAGRIVYQDLTAINKSIEDGSFFQNKSLLKAMNHTKQRGSTLHVMGLLSDGGVHSHIKHLLSLVDMAKEQCVQSLCIHCFLDGRDVPPKCASTYIEQVEKHIDNLGIGTIGVISGRYYAMDRDKRWDRLQKAYDAMTIQEGVRASSALDAVRLAYDRDENDEFILPTVIDGSIPISDGDAVIMYNFRPDRAREITRAFVDEDFDGFKRKKSVSDICYVCMTQYDADMPNVIIAFPPENLSNTLGEYIASLGLTQLRIAETEKYAHVTFFFNGGVEAPNRNEDRILVDSPKVPTYDTQPEMSAFEITEKVLDAISSDKYDLIILNFANADMVGHTGVMDATVEAIEALDECIPRIVEAVLDKDGQLLLTADHGNADVMTDDAGNTVTAHSLNDVPLVHIANAPMKLRDGGRLCDISPTLLTLMKLPVPEEMTGHSLI